MPHHMYCGPVGSGKTFMAVRDALHDAGHFIVTNTPLAEDGVAAFLNDLDGRELNDMFRRADGSVEEVAKEVIVWKDFADPAAFDARCGVLLIDEAPLWLDARKYDSLSPEARMKIIEHRKDDLSIISTAQDVSFIDKVFRTLCDEIRLIRMSRLPFIGWIWPTCVRPTIVCRGCGRVRRDGAGDDRGFYKWLGFGTFYMWDSYKAKDLIDSQDVTGEAVAEAKRIGGGARLFDIRVADAYSTSMKLSQTAKDALAARRGEQKWPKKQGAATPVRLAWASKPTTPALPLRQGSPDGD